MAAFEQQIVSMNHQALYNIQPIGQEPVTTFVLSLVSLASSGLAVMAVLASKHQLMPWSVRLWLALMLHPAHCVLGVIGTWISFIPYDEFLALPSCPVIILVVLSGFWCVQLATFSLTLIGVFYNAMLLTESGCRTPPYWIRTDPVDRFRLDTVSCLLLAITTVLLTYAVSILASLCTMITMILNNQRTQGLPTCKHMAQNWDPTSRQCVGLTVLNSVAVITVSVAFLAVCQWKDRHATTTTDVQARGEPDGLDEFDLAGPFFEPEVLMRPRNSRTQSQQRLVPAAAPLAIRQGNWTLATPEPRWPPLSQASGNTEDRTTRRDESESLTEEFEGESLRTDDGQPEEGADGRGGNGGDGATRLGVAVGGGGGGGGSRRGDKTEVYEIANERGKTETPPGRGQQRATPGQGTNLAFVGGPESESRPSGIRQNFFGRRKTVHEGHTGKGHGAEKEGAPLKEPTPPTNAVMSLALSTRQPVTRQVGASLPSARPSSGSPAIDRRQEEREVSVRTPQPPADLLHLQQQHQNQERFAPERSNSRENRLRFPFSKVNHDPTQRQPLQTADGMPERRPFRFATVLCLTGVTFVSTYAPLSCYLAFSQPGDTFSFDSSALNVFCHLVLIKALIDSVIFLGAAHVS